MPHRIWINNLTFNTGKSIKLEKNDIIVIVGPNNVGKSQLLQDISQLTRTDNGTQKVLKSLEIEKDCTAEEFKKFIEEHSKKEYSENIPIPYYQGINFRIWSNSFGKLDRIKNLEELADCIIYKLDTENRLKSSNAADGIWIKKDPPQHPIHLLEENPSLEKTFSEFFYKAFQQELIVNKWAGSKVPLQIGERSSEIYDNSFIESLDKLPILDEQGDGMRSFTGVLLGSIITPQQIILLDEPEAFLHPWQSKYLGRLLATETKNKQIFISTHSEDIISGLIAANSQRLKVIRITREKNLNPTYNLDTTDIKKLWTNPICRYSDILKGLFYKTVIICESHADCAFYSAVLETLNVDKASIGDIFFTQAGGKNRLKIIVDALIKVGVNVKVISDIDILNDKNIFFNLFKSLGGEEKDLKNLYSKFVKQLSLQKTELNKESIDTVLKEILEKKEPFLSDKDRNRLSEVIKKSSPWGLLKSSGESAIPSGDMTNEFKKIYNIAKDKGLFIVKVGELENFDKEIGGHGVTWVLNVLENDLQDEKKLKQAKEFIKEIIGLND